MTIAGWRSLLIAVGASLAFFMLCILFWWGLSESPAYQDEQGLPSEQATVITIWHSLDHNEQRQPCHLLDVGYDIEEIAFTMVEHYGGDQDYWVIQLSRSCPVLSQ